MAAFGSRFPCSGVYPRMSPHLDGRSPATWFVSKSLVGFCGVSPPGALPWKVEVDKPALVWRRRRSRRLLQKNIRRKSHVR